MQCNRVEKADDFRQDAGSHPQLDGIRKAGELYRDTTSTEHTENTLKNAQPASAEHFTTAFATKKGPTKAGGLSSLTRAISKCDGSKSSSGKLSSES